MNLSVIIPNYNGEKILKKNLPKVYNAVKKYKNGNVEIIIPDDPSTDNSQQVINDFINSIKHPHIKGKTISNKNKKNAGFSKNVNRGVSLSTGDILILLNSDVAPYENFLDSLLSHFRDPSVFAVGCLEESIEEGQKILRGRGIGGWKRGMFFHQKGEIVKVNTLWASGGSSAFRRKVWYELGGLEELYNPYYWEDNDLSYRGLKCGYKVLFDKNSKVIHEHEIGAIKTSVSDNKIKKTAYRNQFIFIWLNITDTNLIISHILWLPYHFMTALLQRDWLFYNGFLSAMKRFPKILKKRKKYSKYFTTSDKVILSQHSA